MKGTKITIPVYGIILLAFMSSCQCNREKAKSGNAEINGDKQEVKIVVERLEKDLFSMKLDSIPQSLPLLKAKYGVFFEIYNHKIIGIGASDDPKYPARLKGFLTDYYQTQNYARVMEVYPNLDKLSADLSAAFTIYQEYFPKKRIPRVFTCVSGWNKSAVTADTILGIGLDMFLGKDCEFYQKLEIAKYLRYSLQYEYMVPTCMRIWGETEFPDSSNNLLGRMLYNAKMLYFVRKMMPDAPDTIIYAMAPSQLKWCKNNSEQMWTYLVEHKLLFSSNFMIIKKLIDPAPFTSFFTSESPGRAVVWLGYQIIEAYMKNNEDTTLLQLMQTSDYQEILRKSNFKP